MMARRPASGPTAGELRLLEVLWDGGPATVQEIQESLDEDLAESTIRTLLRILLEKGRVRRSKHGRAFVYEAVIGREPTRRRAVRELVDRFFGTPGDLVLNVLEDEELGPDEMAALKRLVEAHSARDAARDPSPGGSA